MKISFISLVRQTTPEGQRDFFFNGKDWQQLSELLPTEPESGFALEEEPPPDPSIEQ